MDVIRAYLPPRDGLLPCLLIVFAIASIFNSIQSYTTLYFNQRIYSGPAPKTPYIRASPSAPAHDLSRSVATPLSARTFGAWTLISAVVRLYAAYNIHDARLYQLAFCTYVVAFGHFVSEWLIYKTMSWGAPIAGPIIGSSVTLVWMILQWDYYVK